MKLRNTLLMPTFALILSALSAQAAPVQITALPFSITAPGTYVLTGNLTIPSAQTAITINSVTLGKVVLNLNGRTLTGPGYGNIPGILVGGNPTGSNITIENGTVAGFWAGISASGGGNTYLTNIHISKVTFWGERFYDVLFGQVNASSIENCAFVGLLPQSPVIYGIQDGQTQTGNHYANNSFDGGQSTAIAISFANPVVFVQGQFEEPSAN
jgi:hypothetical protein